MEQSNNNPLSFGYLESVGLVITFAALLNFPSFDQIKATLALSIVSVAVICGVLSRSTDEEFGRNSFNLTIVGVGIHSIAMVLVYSILDRPRAIFDYFGILVVSLLLTFLIGFYVYRKDVCITPPPEWEYGMEFILHHLPLFDYQYLSISELSFEMDSVTDTGRPANRNASQMARLIEPYLTAYTLLYEMVVRTIYVLAFSIVLVGKGVSLGIVLLFVSEVVVIYLATVWLAYVLEHTNSFGETRFFVILLVPAMYTLFTPYSLSGVLVNFVISFGCVGVAYAATQTLQSKMDEMITQKLKEEVGEEAVQFMDDVSKTDISQDRY